MLPKVVPSLYFSATHPLRNTAVLFGSFFRQEEEVLGRIKASLDNPLGYEAAGFALFDMVNTNYVS